MAEREFQIIITGDASGLQDAAKEGASALQDELNPAVESFKKSWAGAAKETEDFASKGELKHMVRELKRDFPELGLLARAFINPLVGGFGILLATLKALDEIFKGIAERSNTGIFSGSFRRDVQQAAKDAMESEVAWGAFKRTMDGVAASQQSVKDKTDAVIESIRAQHVAVVEQLNADKAAALARVDMLEKEQKLTGPQAIQQRLQIEEKFARQKLNADIVAKDGEIEAKRVEAKKLAADAEHEQANAEQYKKDVEDAQTDLQRFEALKAGNTKALADTRAQIKALRGSKFVTPALMGQLRSAEDLQAALETQGAGLTPEEELSKRNALKEAQDRFANSQKRAQELGTAARDLSQKIPGEQAAANQSYVAAGNVAAAERLARTYQATGNLAQQMTQMQDEVNKNVEAGKGVMVTTLVKLKEVTAAFKDLDQRIRSLESPARRTGHL